MKPRKINNHGDARPARGSSAWLWLAVAGLLAVGVRQMFYVDAKKNGTAKPPGQVLAVAQPVQTGWPSTGVNHHQATTGLSDGNPLTDSLGKLLHELQVEDDPMAREELIANFIADLKTEDIPAVLAVLRDEEPSDVADDLSRRLIQNWAKISPQNVAAWINSQPTGSQRQRSLGKVAIVWAGSDLTNAMIWGQSLTEGEERNGVMMTVANEAVRMDPMAALQVAVDLPANAQRDELVCRAAMEWASDDASNAVVWAEQIPDETLRNKVLAGEAVAWAEKDPESAAILAVQELPAGRLQEDTVVSIIERWAQQQPEAVAAWVAEFPRGSLRDAAVDNLITQWSQKDAASAKQWLVEHS